MQFWSKSKVTFSFNKFCNDRWKRRDKSSEVGKKANTWIKFRLISRNRVYCYCSYVCVSWMNNNNNLARTPEIGQGLGRILSYGARTNGQTRIYIHVYTYPDYFSNFIPILTKVSIPFFSSGNGYDDRSLWCLISASLSLMRRSKFRSVRTWGTHMSGLEFIPICFMCLSTVSFVRFNSSAISRVVIQHRLQEGFQDVVPAQDWNCRNKILQIKFGIGVRSIQLFRRHRIIFGLLALHFCPFDGKTIKYAENIVFEFTSSIRHQMKTILQNTTKFFTNKLCYISCWNL